MKENKEKLTPIQNEIIEAIGVFVKDERTTNLLKDFFAGLKKAKEDGKEKSYWEIVKLIIFNKNFWAVFFSHIPSLITLLKCCLKQEYKDAINQPEFTEALLNYEEIKRFNENLLAYKNDILEAIAYIQNLPEDNDNLLLDQKFLREIVTFLETNQKDINYSDLAEIGLLFVQRIAIEKTTKDPQKLQENSIALARKSLELLSKFKGVDKLVESKKDALSKLIAESISVNGVSLGLSKEQVLPLVSNCIENGNLQLLIGNAKITLDAFFPNKEQIAQEIVKEVKDSKDLTKAVLEVLNNPIEENRNKLLQTAAKVLKDNEKVEKLKSLIAEAEKSFKDNQNDAIKNLILLCSNELHSSLDAIKNVPISNFCLEIDPQLSEDGKVIYKLSALGNTLVNAGLLKLTNNGNRTPDSFRMIVNGEIEFEQDGIAQKVQQYFGSANKKIKSVKVDKQLFDSLFVQNIDISSVEKLLPKVIESKELLQSFSAFFDKDIAATNAVGMILQKLISSNELVSELIAQKDQICLVIKNSLPKEKLQEFGLEENVLDIIPIILSKKENLESIYHIICHMNGGNNPDMVSECMKLLQNNPEIGEFLKGKDINSQIVNLVKVLTTTVPLMSEFFNRTEFKLLSNNLTSELQSFLPTVLKIGTGQELTSVLIKNMEASKIINGLMFHKDSSAVVNREDAEKAAKAIYLFIIHGKNKNSWESIKESAAVLGITTYPALQARIESAKIYIAANKLHNEIFALTKFDEKDDQKKKETLQKKKQIIIKAIRNSKNLNELSATLKGKVSNIELSFIVTKFNEYKAELTPNFNERFIDEKQIFARLAYETQISSLEKEFDTSFSNIHSNVFFMLSEKINNDNNELNKEELITFIEANSLVLSKDQRNKISDAIFQDNDKISKNEVRIFFNDLSCRKKGAEDIGNIQQMLTSLLSPFAQLSDRPFDEEELKVTQELIEALENDKSWSREEIKAKLKEYFKNNPKQLNKILNELFIVIDEEGHATTTDLQSSLELMLESQKLAKDNHEDTKNLLNKILSDFSEKEEFKTILNKVILEKGSPESISKIALTLVGSIFSNESQYSKKEKELFLENVLPMILNNILLPNGTNLESNIIQVIKVGAIKLLNDPTKVKTLSELELQLSLAIDDFNWKNFMNLKDLTNIIWNLGSISIAFNVLKNINNIELSKLQPEQLNEWIKEARIGNNSVDVRGILRKYMPNESNNALYGKDLSTVDFSNTMLSTINFTKTKLPSSFNNVKFEKCNFNNLQNNLQNDEIITFENVTFDIESFKSLYSALTQKELSGFFGESVKVISNLCGEVDAKLFIELSIIYKETYAKDPKKFDELLFDCHQKGISYDDLKFARENNLHNILYGKSSNQHDLTLDTIKNAKKILEEKGLTIEMLKNEFSSNTPLHAIHKTLIQNISETGIAEDELFDDKKVQTEISKNIATLKNIKTFNENTVASLNEVLDEYNSKQQLLIIEQISKYSDRVNNLTEEKINDLVAYCANNGKNIEKFITILESENYKDIKSVASQLDNKQPWKLYEELNAVDVNNLITYKNWLEENPIVEDRENTSFNKILKAWYVQRVIGNQNPKESRKDGLTQVGCLKKALDYDKSDNLLASFITHKIVKNLFENRIFNTPDRMHDAQRIYDAVVIASLNNLSKEEQQDLLNNPKAIEEFAGKDYKSGLSKLLYDKSKYEGVKVKKDLYLPEDLNIAEIIESKFSSKDVLITTITAKEPSINKEVHDQLFTLSENELKDIQKMDIDMLKSIISYCERSGVTVQDMMQHSQVLTHLNGLSDELKKRYELAGDKKSEKFCLQLVVKLYNDNPQVKDLIDSDSTMLANMIFIKLQKLQTGKPPVKLENLDKCVSEVSKLFNNKHTKEFAKTCSDKGQEIANKIFTDLKIADTWVKTNSQHIEEAKQNLAKILASIMFSNDKIIEDKDIGEAKQATGMFSAKYSGSTGVIKIFSEIFYATANMNNPWHEIPGFDSKDNHTMRLVKGIDDLISGKSQGKTM